MKLSKTKKAIAVHVLFLIGFLIATMYVLGGEDPGIAGRFMVVGSLIVTQWGAVGVCIFNDLYFND